jgi:hypothetical protein
MNSMKKIIACKALLGLAAFLISSCGDWEFEPDDSHHFSFELRGRWFSNDPDAYYSGTLEIAIDRITITGFGERQTPEAGDDNKRPFKDFPKGVALKGYSEDGKIFIEVGGLVQDGIPYTYESNSIAQTNLIYFNFSGRKETMQRDRG